MTKRIAKLEASIDAMLMTQTTAFGMGSSFGVNVSNNRPTNINNIVLQQQRNKKGRLYSLGGNEPAKRPRGRLDRLKTVGTFDLGMEMSVLGDVARSLNTQIISNRTLVVEAQDSDQTMELRNAANKCDSSLVASDSEDSNRCTENRLFTSGKGSITIDKFHQWNHKNNEAAHTKTNFNKIELDMQSIEDITKCCDDTTGDVDGGSTASAVQALSSRKPILLKSKHIVRSDSEIVDDLRQSQSYTVPLSNHHKIVLQSNYDIQIHKEPNYDLASNPDNTPLCNTDMYPMRGRQLATVAAFWGTNSGSQIEYNPDDDCFSSAIVNEDFNTSIDGISKNMFTEDIDNVFSHTNELEQLERGYREILRSNLQREYKSDSDTLDEAGKKCTEFNTWKNQSFENTFELYDEGKVSKVSGSRVPYKNESLTTSTNEVDSSPIVIKPILKQTSSKESTVSSPLQTNRPSQLPIDRRTANLVSNKDELKLTATATSLFEKRFGKICKINSLLKCKRFSTSALYEKKSATITNATESSLSYSPTNKPTNSSSSDSKTSLHSSKLSLFHCKAGRGLFTKRKPSMSQTELNQFPTKVIQRTRVTPDHTKSHSDIHGYKTSSTSTASNPVHTVMYRQPLQSPLSEEFYNPTGSVRLSAIELFEKFCSEDFSGLYKNETTMLNLDRRGGTCGEYQSLHEYRLGQRGLGVTQKYNRINQDMQMRLLRQKSEPKFTFNDETTMGADGFFDEEDDEDVYDEQEGDMYELEDGDYDEDEYDEFEQQGEEEVMCEEDEVLDNENDDKNLDRQPDTLVANYPTVNCLADVDEILLMPPHSEYDECGFENKQFTLEQSFKTHIVNDADDNQKNSDKIRTIALPPNVRLVRKSEDGDVRDEVLTIYMRCSKDDIPETSTTTITNNTLSSATVEETSPTRSSLVNVADVYMQNAPADLFDDDFDCIYHTDCLNQISLIESFDHLSSPSCTILSGGTCRSVVEQPHCLTFGRYAVVGQQQSQHQQLRNNNQDTCSTTSKLSLSLKSEIFDDLILSPDSTDNDNGDQPDQREVYVARSCDFEDFRLTPDETAALEDSLLVPANLDQYSLTNGRTLSSTVNGSPLSESIIMSIVNVSSATEEVNNLDVSTFGTEIKKKYDAIFTSAMRDDEQENKEMKQVGESFRLNASNNHTDVDANILAPNKTPSTCSVENHTTATTVILSGIQDVQCHYQPDVIKCSCTTASTQSTPLRQLSTRYSMQCLEPYLMFDEQSSASGRKSMAMSMDSAVSPNMRRQTDMRSTCMEKSPTGAVTIGGVKSICIGTGNAFGGVINDVSDRSFFPKHIAVRRRDCCINKLQSNRSQSLGNLSNKTRCFPL